MRSPRTAPPPATATRKPRWPPSTAEGLFQTAKLLPSAGIHLFALHWSYELNALENWYCSTSFWRWMTRERLLPWLLGRADLGDRVLEIGAGAGAATAELRKRASYVVSLEYDPLLVTRLAQRNGNGAGIVQGDAAALPFTDRTFSSAVAVLTLHHLRSSEQQDRAFAEVHRVLQPGGRLFAFEIPDGWFN